MVGRKFVPGGRRKGLLGGKKVTPVTTVVVSPCVVCLDGSSTGCGCGCWATDRVLPTNPTTSASARDAMQRYATCMGGLRSLTVIAPQPGPSVPAASVVSAPAGALRPRRDA